MHTRESIVDFFFPGDCSVWASTVGAAAAMQLALPVLFTVEPEEGTVPHPVGLLLRQRSQHEYSQGGDELEAHRRLSPRTGHWQKRAFGSAGSYEQQQLSTIPSPYHITYTHSGSLIVFIFNFALITSIQIVPLYALSKFPSVR